MATNFVAEAFSLLAISLIFIALRVYSRWSSVGFRQLAADDYLMVVAGLLYTAETVAAYCVGAYWHGLANNSMTAEERAALDPASEEWILRVNGSKTQLLGWLVYTVLLWTLKTCMIIFYSRLTDGVNNMVIRIRIGAVFLAVTFVATFLSILLGCYPIEKHWQINPDPGNLCQPAVSKLQVAVLITLNISTDIYLMSVPLPLVWKARLTPRKKYILLVMFSGGFFVIVAGMLRCILILTAGADGPMKAGEWSCRESFIAVTVGNLPMLYSLFQRATRNTWLRSTILGKSSDDRSYPLGSRRTGEPRKGKKHRHPLSMPNDTTWGSDERIVLPPNTTVTEIGPTDTKDGSMNDHGTSHDSFTAGKGITVVTDWSVKSSKE